MFPHRREREREREGSNLVARRPLSCPHFPSLRPPQSRAEEIGEDRTGLGCVRQRFDRGKIGQHRFT